MLRFVRTPCRPIIPRKTDVCEHTIVYDATLKTQYTSNVATVAISDKITSLSFVQVVDVVMLHAHAHAHRLQ